MKIYIELNGCAIFDRESRRCSWENAWLSACTHFHVQTSCFFYETIPKKIYGNKNSLKGKTRIETCVKGEAADWENIVQSVSKKIIYVAHRRFN